MELKLYEINPRCTDRLYVPGIVAWPGYYRYILIVNQDDPHAYELIFTSGIASHEDLKAVDGTLLSPGATSLIPPVEIKLVRSYPNIPKEIDSPHWRECGLRYSQILDPIKDQLKEIVLKYHDRKPEFEELACVKFIESL